MKTTDHFLSCDWGTTSFRLRLVSLTNCEVHHELKEPSGVKTINDSLPKNLAPSEVANARADEFENFFKRKVDELFSASDLTSEPMPIVISGMASSSVGWKELPYSRTPFPLDGAGMRFDELEFKYQGQPYPIYLLSGLRTETDIMRGEETEILGLYFSGEFADVFENGTVLLPGTHSKHVQLLNGAIKSFHTYMTGELYEVLAQHSLLKASIDENVAGTPQDDPRLKEAFIAGVQQAQSSGLSRSLFQVRTRSILQGADPKENRWFLSGLLIGTEVDDLVSQTPTASILISAPSTIATLYQLALNVLSTQLTVKIVPSDLIDRAAVLGQAVWLKQNILGKSP